MRFVRSALISSAVIGSVVVMAGCQSNPSTAAYVGDRTVSTKQLQNEVAKGYGNAAIKSTFSQADYRGVVLQNQIAHVLVAQAAKQAKVTVASNAGTYVRGAAAADIQAQGGSPDQVAASLVQQGIAPSQQPAFLQDVALEGALAYQKRQISAYRMGLIQVKDQKTAQQVAKALRADESKYVALAKRNPAPNTNAAPFVVSSFRLEQSLKQSGPVAVRPHSSAIVPDQGGGFDVEYVFATDVPLKSATPQQLGALLYDGYGVLSATLLKKPGMKIRVNPRFGSWNAKQGKVDGAANPAVLTPKASKSPQTSQ